VPASAWLAALVAGAMPKSSSDPALLHDLELDLRSQREAMYLSRDLTSVAHPMHRIDRAGIVQHEFTTQSGWHLWHKSLGGALRPMESLPLIGDRRARFYFEVCQHSPRPHPAPPMPLLSLTRFHAPPAWDPDTWRVKEQATFRSLLCVAGEAGDKRETRDRNADAAEAGHPIRRPGWAGCSSGGGDAAGCGAAGWQGRGSGSRTG
jgi:hypothetical protein